MVMNIKSYPADAYERTSMFLDLLGQMGIQVERVSREAIKGIAKDVAEM